MSAMTNEPLRRLKQTAIDMRDSLTYSGFDIGNTERGEVEALLDVIDEFTRPTPDDGRPVAWTDEQCIEFMSVALRHTEYKNGGPTITEIRQGAQRAMQLPTPPTARPGPEPASTPIGHVTYRTALSIIAHAYRLGVARAGYAKAVAALYDACDMGELRIAGDVDAEQVEFTSERLNAHLAESYATILDDLAMCRSRTAEGFNLNQAAKLLRHYAVSAPKPAGYEITEDQFDSAADAYQDVFDGENHRAALRHALLAALAPGGEGN